MEQEPKNPKITEDDHEKRLGEYLDKSKKEKFANLGKPPEQRLEEIRQRREKLEDEVNNTPAGEDVEPTILVELEHLQEEEQKLLEQSDLPI